MHSGSQPVPGPFSRAVAEEVRSEMARLMVSGAELARLTGRSQSYLSKRLRGESAFTATDVEDICRALKVDLLSLLTAAVRASRQ
jgi:transcriptional regulator with XRE-family HTH domain